MAIIAVPSILGFTNVGALRLRRSTNILRSRYTAQAQKVSLPYAIWMLEGKLRPYQDAQAGIIRSFLVQLDGQKNEFRLPVPGYTKPISGYPNNAAMDVAAAARATSITVAAPASAFNFLSEGDYFVIQDELKLVTAAVNLNGANKATISFKPPLRKAAAVGVAVTLQNPWCYMQAADDDVAEWAIEAPVIQNSPFNAIEAIGI